MNQDIKNCSTEDLYKTVMAFKRTLICLHNAHLPFAVHEDLKEAISFNLANYNVLFNEFKERPDAKDFDPTINSLQGIVGD